MKRRQFLTSFGAALAIAPHNATAEIKSALDIQDFLAKAVDGAFLIRDLYNPDQSWSDLALASQGERVTFTGFMAPPLKAESKFFVLTKMPMAVCPFCEPEAEWPRDILPVYAKRVVSHPPSFNIRIQATGFLEIGEYIDPDTGFYSLIRLTDATYQD